MEALSVCIFERKIIYCNSMNVILKFSVTTPYSKLGLPEEIELAMCLSEWSVLSWDSRSLEILSIYQDHLPELYLDWMKLAPRTSASISELVLASSQLTCIEKDICKARKQFDMFNIRGCQ